MSESLSRLSWVIRMIVRDSRKSATTLLLLVSSVFIGVVAIVALGAFRANVEQAIDEQAKSLLGADLVVASRSAFTEEVETFLEQIPGERARELSFASMAYFPKEKRSRLVQINALSGAYPFFGEMETAPEHAAKSFREKEAHAVVDEGLLFQFDAQVGDVVQIGELTLRIEGSLQAIPGVVDARNAVAPRVYIRLEDLEATALMQRGSRVRYKEYYRLGNDVDAEAISNLHKAEADTLYLTIDTVESRKESLETLLASIYRFLDLIASIALLLGGVGVASAANVYIRRKEKMIAVLRCLGAQPRDVFQLFALQIAIFALLGSLAGAGFGVFLQRMMPALVSTFLPVSVPFAFHWPSVCAGVSLGVLLVLIFSFGPIWSGHLIPPLASFRNQYEQGSRSARTRVLTACIAILLFAVVTALQVGSFVQGLAFSLALTIILLVLYGVASMLRGTLRRAISHTWPFSIRQGFANLYRPNNQTILLMVSVGLSVLVVVTVLFARGTVLAKIFTASSAGKPNMILFDIQGDQRESVRALLAENQMSVIDAVPIVTMRLMKIKGRSVVEVRNDESLSTPDWALTREYRSTYRNALNETEKVIRGTFITKRVSADSLDRIPVSLEKRIAEQLNVDLGDSLTFNVQGVEIETSVQSIREVDWQNVQPNFFVIFPEGVLEDAPQIHVFVTRTDTKTQAAAFQRASVEAFPNVSIIDVSLVLKTLDAITERLAVVVHGMSACTVLTALCILFSVVLGSRGARVREYVLLKTLGASRGTLFKITLAEYGLLGLLASCTGGALALGASWAMASYVLESPLQASFEPFVAVMGISFILATLVGVLASEGTYRAAAIDVLREASQ